MSVAARNAAASDAQSVTTSADRDRKQTEEYETCVRQTGIAWIEIYVAYLFRQFYDYPSPDRTAFAHVFHRGTPGVRSLQAERTMHNTRPLDTEKSW